jgi:hypothetical protein
LHRLTLVVEMIATLEAERDAIVENEASTHVNAEKIQALHKLKAIDPEFATVLVGEIFHRDFNNRRRSHSKASISLYRRETNCGAPLSPAFRTTGPRSQACAVS